jgi:hypothetical protein
MGESETTGTIDLFLIPFKANTLGGDCKGFPMSCARFTLFALAAACILATLGPLPVTAQTPAVHAGAPKQSSTLADTATYRVDCGGPAFIDSKGQAWAADAHFVGGGTISYPGKIKGTDMQLLYQSERYYDPAKTPMKYTFPVPNGNYKVNLLFAETYPGFNKAGYRVFDVTLNGTPVLTSFDISGAVGVDSALAKEFPIRVTTGTIVIGFINRVEHAKISGIEIVPDPGVSIPITEARNGMVAPTWAARPAEASGSARDVRGRRTTRAALRSQTGFTSLPHAPF